MFKKIFTCSFAALLGANISSNAQLPGPMTNAPEASQAGLKTSDCEDLGEPDCAALIPNAETPLAGIGARGLARNEFTSRSGMDRAGSEIARAEHDAPEPPTEFQRFVNASTGQMLPLYGAALLDRAPSTFAAANEGPAPADHIVGPGDAVDVRVWGQLDFDRHLKVDQSGDIYLPRAGRVRAVGLTLAQLDEAVRTALRRVYMNFELSVSMGDLRAIQILVVGQARRPGTYTISPLSTLVNALFLCGGPSSRGSLRDIQVRRGGQIQTHFDFYDLLLGGDKSKDIALAAGDVVFIPNAGPRVAVEGSVLAPAIYELTETTSFKDLLQYAGGLSPTAGQRAILERIENRATLRAEELSVSADGLAAKPRDGDIVQVLSITPRFDQTVTLRGNVADPIRAAWYPGMKISALIPSKESLLTRGYWQLHNNLVDPVVEANSQAAAQASTLDERGATPALFRQNARSTNDASLGSAAGRADRVSVREFLKRNELQPLAPDINWGYASIERLDGGSLATHIVPFNLGKVVLEHDAAADVELAAGDIVTVFSNADITVPREQQTKYVRIEGEVKGPGVYSAAPGETLRDLVARAGGLTADSYLYGAQFTRESTRREQEQRYAAYLDQLEIEIDQSEATLAGRAATPNLATTQLSLESQRQLVAKMRQVTITGRIVLDLRPGTSGLDSVPNVPLENGDRFFIPPVPSTVNVVGMVNNQAAFLYVPDVRMANYLREAGGPSRWADPRRAFVIRADGSVVGRHGRSVLRASGFDSLEMHPGDTLVIPTNLSRTTALRNLLDWSQVIGNFGLGAAAINVLR